MVYRYPLSFWDKTITLGAFCLAGAIFLTVGWITVEPRDPQGAVSLLACGTPLLTLLEVVALAGVTGALATAVAGRCLPDVGTFAVALGLAAVSLRGGNAATLLVDNARESASFQHGLAVKFLFEAVGWFVVMLAGLFASSVVMHMLFSSPESGRSGTAGDSTDRDWILSAHDIPGLERHFAGVDADRPRTSPRVGLTHALISAVVAWLAITLFFKGLSARSIEHGQACSLVAIAVWLGTWLAHRWAPVRSALWPVLSVLLLAVMGYLWTSVKPVSPALPSHLPQSNFLRVLPMQFVAFGTAAAIATFWWLHTGRSREPDGARRPRGRSPGRRGRA